MPNYDLGTAHGKVRVEGDARGVEEVNKSVGGFRRALDDVKSRVGAFNSSLNRVEAELRTVRRDFEETSRAAKDFDNSLGDVDIKVRRTRESTRQWTGDLGQLHDRLRGVSATAATFGPVALQMGQFARAMNSFRGSDVGNLSRVARSLFQIGAASTVLSIVKGHFLGIGAAMSTLGPASQNVVKFANSFRLLTFGIGVLTRFEVVSRSWTAAAQFMARYSQDAGIAMLKLGDGIEKAMGPIKPAINWIKGLNENLDKVAGGAVNSVAGFALLRSGMTGLSRNFGFLTGNIRTGNYYLDMFAKTLRFFVMPGILLSSAALQGLGVVLTTTSNLLMGLWNGVKQLSGGLLAIPGGIMMAVAAFGTLKVIMGGIKDSFKDIFKNAGEDGDPKKLAEAINKLPEALKPFGQALADTTPKWKALRTEMVAGFLGGGADQQLRALTDQFLPNLRKGALQVTESWKMAKDRLFEFVSQGQTMGAMNAIFMHTSQTMNAVTQSMNPALAGLRDIGVVGSTFIRTLAEDYLPRVISKFGDWATKAAQSGNAMKWMDNSIRGVKDLYTGFTNAAEGAWKLLTVFKTNTGGGFLDRFANEMVKFNNAVSRSASSGFLRKISDEVKGLGTDKLKELFSLIKELVPAIQAFVHMMSQAGQAMNTILIPVLQLAVTVITQFIQVLNALGLGPIVGTIMGLVGAFKVLAAVLGPVINLIKVFAGIKLLKSGFESIVLNAGAALEKFGGIGQKAADKLVSGGARIASAFNAITAVVAAAIIAWSTYEDGSRQIDAAHKQMAEGAKHTKESVDDLKQAFLDDKGIAGSNVATAMKHALDTMISDAGAAADKMPGFAAEMADGWNHSWDAAFGSGRDDRSIETILFGKLAGEGSSPGMERLKQVAQQGKNVQNAFAQLGETTSAMTNEIQGSDAAFNGLVDRLRATGDGSQDAINKVQMWRDQYVALQRDMERVGPGGAQLAEGIKKIAEAGGNAQTKLEGLKLALEGLGLLKTDYYEAAANYAKSIAGLADAATQAAAGAKDLNTVLKANGDLNVEGSDAARKLLDVMQPLAENFLAVSSKTGDAQAAFAQLQPSIEAVGRAFGLTQEQVLHLFEQLGVAPKVVDILVRLGGKDQATQDLTAMILAFQTAASHAVEIPVKVKNPHELSTEINRLLGGDYTHATDNLLLIEPKLDPAAMERVKTLLQQQGIFLPGAGAPQGGQGAQIPLFPGAPAGGPAPAQFGPVGPGGSRLPLPGEGQAPAAPAPPPPATAAPVPGQPPNLGPMAPFVPTTPVPPAQLPTTPPPTPQTPAVPPAAAAAIAAPQDREVHLKMIVEGMDQLTKIPDVMNGVVEQVNAGINGLKTSFSGAFGDILRIVQTFAQQATETLNNASRGAMDSGKAFTQAFADGIKDPAKLQAVHDAAIAAAEAAAAPMPHSPARVGPLSGRGWTGYSGRAFSSDFAQGISAGAQDVGGAAMGVAGAAASGIKGQGKTPFLGQISQLLQFAEHLNSAFASISSTFFNFLKYASDPTGKGETFFGQPTGKKTADTQSQIKTAGTPDDGQKTAGDVTAAAPVNAKSSRNQIAMAIGSAVLKAGYNRDTAIGAIAAADLESGLSPAAMNAGHNSLFQTSADKGIPSDPNAQIQWFISQLNAAGGPSAVGKDPLNFIADKIERGGYPGSNYQQFTGNAASIVDALMANTAATGKNTTAVTSPGSLAGMGQAGAAQGAPTGPPPNEKLIRQWAQQNFGIPNSFGTGSWENASHPADQGWHGKGYGFDFHGTPEEMSQMANWIAQNASQQTLELIYQGPGFDPKNLIKNTQLGAAGVYGPGLLSQHTDHVHWATTVAPYLANANADAMKNAGVISGGDQAAAAGADQQQQQNPIDQMSGIASGASGIAGDLLQTMQSVIEAIGATKDLTDTLVRGPANTQDIMKMIDDVQKYIDVAAKVAKTVGDVASTVASMTGGMDMGASGGVAAGAQLISGILQGINAAIDLGQEAWQIFGSYFGSFLGTLTGGNNQLMGDVKFLLDQNQGVLYNYTTDNPMNRQGHAVPGALPGAGINAQTGTQTIGQLNYYAGPGTDPRDATRQMMYQVKAAQVGTVTAG